MKFSELNLTTDLIVGFPGKSPSEFRDSLDLVEEIGFSHVHIFGYSARAGTVAARLPGQLPRAVKQERSQAMHRLAARLKAQRLAEAIGQERPVLWEGHGRPQPDGTRRWSGYTDHYMRVETTQPAEVELHNRITPTRLEAVVEGSRLRGRPA